MSYSLVQQLVEIFQKLTRQEQEEFLSKVRESNQQEEEPTPSYDKYLSKEALHE